MSERIPPQMASASTSVTTVPPHTEEEPVEGTAVLTLRPSEHVRTRRNSKRVVWTEDTVDNEHMNKKKSKCCCIYEKPRKFGEDSDSDSSDDECEHCFGHVEKKKKNVEKKLALQQESNSTVTIQEDSMQTAEPEPSVSITLPSSSKHPHSDEGNDADKQNDLPDST